ncbi:glutamate ABC transporter substrate-binding protein [Millisia brevis]|uniref:glutamate ABC transporter substrate-binding protein n=1 Tax=Millisia brevis TaxID=264148 RepID=UPI00082BB730|nr:glutamate ABC transporter substrate-binding protein [Millisia brevis]
MSGRVNVRRPAILVAVAAVLATIALAVPIFRPEIAVPEPSGQTMAEGSAGVSEACDTIVASLRPDGPLPEPGVMPAGSTMAAIVARGHVTVGVEQGNYLLGFRNPATGTLEGAEIDIARRVSEALFGTADRVRFVAVAVADRQAVLGGGPDGASASTTVDMVINSYSVTCERQRSVEFSAPYLQVSQRLLVPTGSGIREVEDLAGQRVCTSAGSTTEQILLDLPVGLQVITRPGVSGCVVELLAGRVEAVSSDDVILAGMAAQDPQTEVVGRALDNTDYAIGISKQTTDLVRFVNAVLASARADGMLAASDRFWFADHLSPVPLPPAVTYRD